MNQSRHVPPPAPAQPRTRGGTVGGRIRCPALRRKLMPADAAAELIPPGANVGMSGFTGAGYPKVVPGALAARMMAATAAGRGFRVNIWTGASTAPELDGALAAVGGIHMRLPYQSDPVCREQINTGQMEYTDIHLSHVAEMVWERFLGPLDVAVIEVTGITEDGRLIPSSSVGNNKTWIDQADRVIVEVNSWQDERLEGMHDVYYGTRLPPDRQPLMITRPGDRIGTPYFTCPPEKVVAVVETDAPDRSSPFRPPDEASRRIAGHLLEFLEHEVQQHRLPERLLPLQSGVGNIANAVLLGLEEGPFEGLTAYTEVIQDGMLDLMATGKLTSASATAFSLSPEGLEGLRANFDRFRDRLVLRSQEISNHPEVIRRLGCLAMNGMIEADIYGNVNSTHIMGTRIQNGIGGSGDFARNSYLSFFMSPSVIKGGTISTIVPMVSHVDHCEHDVDILVTEQGLADLRGTSPKQRAEKIIEQCVHPDYRKQLREYYRYALQVSPGKHTPHILEEALGWHSRFQRTGTMRA